MAKSATVQAGTRRSTPFIVLYKRAIASSRSGRDFVATREAVARFAMQRASKVMMRA